MIGASLFLVGKNYSDGAYVEKSNPCALCKRMIINAGLKDVYIRDSKTEYRHIPVEDFINNDESIDGSLGY